MYAGSAPPRRGGVAHDMLSTWKSTPHLAEQLTSTSTTWVGPLALAASIVVMWRIKEGIKQASNACMGLWRTWEVGLRDEPLQEGTVMQVGYQEGSQPVADGSLHSGGPPGRNGSTRRSPVRAQRTRLLLVITPLVPIRSGRVRG